MKLKVLVKKIIYFPYDVVKRIYVHSKRVKFSKNLTIRGKIHILNRGEISFGENCVINGSNKYNPIGFCGVCNIVTEKGAKIYIGNKVGLSGTTIYSRCSIIIGDNVMLGGGVKVYDTDFHSLNAEFRGTPEDKANTVNKPVVIEDNVFIGAGSIVLKGVHIGSNSIIGAGSVVTKDIPENEIWAGNPAKFIKKI